MLIYCLHRLRRLAYLLDIWAGGPVLTCPERSIVMICWMCLFFVVLKTIFNV